jgi:superoxide dismutase
MAPPNSTALQGKLKDDIEKSFNSVDAFKTQFTDTGKLDLVVAGMACFNQ